MRLEHRIVRYRQPGFHIKGGKEQFPCLQRPGHPGEGDTWVLPILLLRLNKSPHPEQPHPDAPAPHFGLRDEGLLVHDSQLRSHVEACCLPWTQHFGANRGEQKEMNTGTYPYFTLNHWLSQPVIPFSHQLYRVIPVTSPERNCDKFLKKKELNPVGSTIIRIQKICY